MDTLTKIIFLMNERNYDNQMLATALGLNRQVVTDWKAGRSKSYKKYIYQIAEIFGVTVNYLLGNEESEPEEKEKSNPEIEGLDEYEKKLLNAFRQTTIDGKLRILNAVDEITKEIEKNSFGANSTFA